MTDAPNTEPLLSVQDLAVGFTQGGRTTRAVDGVSFALKRGGTLALVGESGSGKSVTAMAIARLLEASGAQLLGGRIVFAGRDLLTTPEAEMRRIRGRAITMVFQEPMTSLNPLHTIEKQLGEILELHGLAGGAEGPHGNEGFDSPAAPRGHSPRKRSNYFRGSPKLRPRVVELLAEVGIPDPASRLGAFPHQLSGGQRQRVMIAMALANRPDLLIADEPTTALDVTVQAQILRLLKDLQAKLGMAMLFITHDLGIVRRIADDVCVMQKGRIVEAGPAAAVFRAPRHAYTQMLLAAEPKGAPPVSDPSAPSILKAEHLKVWFPIRRGFLRRTVGHVKAVDGISLDVREGQTVGVVGESGSGKTTLGLAILRLIRSEGPVSYLGRRIDGLSTAGMRPLRRDLQVVFQDPYGSLSPRLSVFGIVEEGLAIGQKRPYAQRREIVAKALADTGLDPASMDRYPHEFSGGQRQRIAIARAMVLEPKFVVLDEPTSALDMSVQAQIVDLLRELQRQRGLAYLFISHDLKVVRALATEIVVMKAGRVVEAGSAAEVFAAPQSDYTRALFAAAFRVEAVNDAAVAAQ